MRVERATAGTPEPEIQAIPQVDNALKQFLNALGGRPAGLPWFPPPPQARRR